MKREPKPIRDLVNRAMDDLGVRPRFLDRITAAWPRVVGARMSKRLTPVSFRNQTLTLRAANSTVKYEAESFHREKILEGLRRELPEINVIRIRVTGS